jgi:hypothetical protein
MIKLAFAVFIGGISIVVIKPLLIKKMCAMEFRSEGEKVLNELNIKVPIESDDDILLANEKFLGVKCSWE